MARDPGALRAAAYAAGSQDLSIWMNPSEVDSLGVLLEAKTVLCDMRATRVERINSPRLSGVLIIREQDHCVHLVLEYFSPPDVVDRTGGASMSGIATMLVDRADSEAMNLARAIVASFAIE
jgi:hypothetical protein